jgi:truncated hemoglobin YjbI
MTEPRGLDAERLAQAIWERHYAELDDEDISDWMRDLDNAFESFGSPRAMAKEIAAEYTRLSEAPRE